ncbi:MAG: hypothetical protein ACI9DC_003566 [Gammaproteobacteria bacterium]|jgi:hypothetical protein
MRLVAWAGKLKLFISADFQMLMVINGGEGGRNFKLSGFDPPSRFDSQTVASSGEDSLASALLSLREKGVAERVSVSATLHAVSRRCFVPHQPDITPKNKPFN